MAKRILKARAQLKADLRKQGTSFAQTAQQLDMSATSLTFVSQGVHHTRRVEQAFANALNTTPEALFPERYGAVENEGASE